MKPLIIVLIILLSSCRAENTEDCHQIITFKNQSVTPVYARVQWTTKELDPSFNHIKNGKILYYVEANSNNTYETHWKDCWEDLFLADSLYVYIFDAQVIEQEPWEQTVAQKKYVLYSLTLQDFQQRNWVVTYP